ncbi:hypothetical protein P22_0724 [Propionispora sp. 2/2-37]|uniref:TIM barrel protein n=1 Tax=Propionispora sp. 2/2-37 TaxID=1677858 RepID=UPI0006BB6782|nr:TIM barrel protein [Propionispora sp. 2/2-37]CUH94658.1 hypothetical protein P22_0724 [Propionispora sp. 2/2-37]
MLHLVNLSNYSSDLELINHSATCLRLFLEQHRLDGVEMMFCGPWDGRIHRREWVRGVHLKFWPYWLDFWRGDFPALIQHFGNEEMIIKSYGGLRREDWLQVYRENIRQAKATGAEYLVFHVSHARIPEMFSGSFGVSDREVVEAAAEVVNRLADEIPDDMMLLFENLWWPGLTLQESELVAWLLEHVTPAQVGLMLDTGHLMNTNTELKSEEEGVDYIIQTVEQLGSYKRYIKGIHLHCSLSGQYSKESRQKANRAKRDYSMKEVMDHVLRLDEHRPFSSAAVRRIIDCVRPDYVVHEFMQLSLQDWMDKVTTQQLALGVRR